HVTYARNHRPGPASAERPQAEQATYAARPTRRPPNGLPGPAGGQHKGDRPRASAPTSARPRKRPAWRGLFSASPVRRRPNPSSPPTSGWWQNQDRRAASATPNAPAASSRQFHDPPKLAILREPRFRRPAPSGTPYSAGGLLRGEATQQVMTLRDSSALA